MAKNSKLRLPVKEIKEGEYYFVGSVSAVPRIEPINPTSICSLATVHDICSGMNPTCRFRFLVDLCQHTTKKSLPKFISNYSFYQATEEEVAAAIEQQRKSEYDRVDLIINGFRY